MSDWSSDVCSSDLAIGLLADIEQNRLKEDHPLSTVIMDQIHSRRVIYCAVLLHDIAKGRGGDHSVLGAELALRVCPRLGLSDAETETVSGLVRYPLLMAAKIGRAWGRGRVGQCGSITVVLGPIIIKNR